MCVCGGGGGGGRENVKQKCLTFSSLLLLLHQLTQLAQVSTQHVFMRLTVKPFLENIGIKVYRYKVSLGVVAKGEFLL